jgi:hypothetical protein
MKPSTSLCVPIAGYFDDGTSNPIASPCTPPCFRCSGTAIYCVSCISNAYYLDSILHQCNLCDSSIIGCLTCSMNFGILNCNSCDVSKGFILATNSLSCNCAIDSYMDTIMLQCYGCSTQILRCSTCSTNAAACTSC